MNGTAVEVIAFVVLAGVLVAGGVTDWRTGKIYNWLTGPAMLVGLLLWLSAGLAGAGELNGGVEGLKRSGFAMLAALVPMTLIFAAGGLGGGDVKLMGAVGAISGDWRCVMATAMYAFIVGGLMAVVLMIRNRLVWQTITRLFLVAAKGKAASQAPAADGPRVAFGAAICVGGIAAGVEYLLGVNYPWTGIGP